MAVLKANKRYAGGICAMRNASRQTLSVTCVHTDERLPGNS